MRAVAGRLREKLSWSRLMMVVLLWIATTMPCVTGFSPQWNHLSTRPNAPNQASTARSMMLLGDELIEAVNTARSEFFLWFFGASGSAGIARGQFPKMYQQVQYIQGLKGQGPTLGGEKIGLNPLCGYPEDLAIQDVEQVANNPLSIRDIIKRFPNDGSFLAKKGYLTFTAFRAANDKANPLAVRAVFDTFAQSTDICAPEVAEQKLSEFRQDPRKLNGALLASKSAGWSSIGLLLFLLGLADFVAAGHAYHGWFPDWPGGRDFPWSLADPNDGAIWNIPKYWI